MNENLTPAQPFSLHEECGVFGVYGNRGGDAASRIFYGLYALQHRGQESCGIAVNDLERVACFKDVGLVSEVFTPERLSSLRGHIGIGHTRYSTMGSCNRENAQPLAVGYVKGTLTLAHNGNIANAAELRHMLEREGAIFQSTTDIEVIAFLIARERVKAPSVELAVLRVIPMLKGSFSLLIMSPKKLIAVRDPCGIRPLCIGECEDGTVVFSSESCALNATGAKYVRDVRPGEVVIAEGVKSENYAFHGRENLRSLTECCTEGDSRSALCIFEHIYFARPDSVIDGQSVYLARVAAGRRLAVEHPVDADIVIGVPDSGIAAAVGYAEQSGIPYGLGLIKNRYIGRTFIQPVQSMREKSVSIKLNTLEPTICGKRVVMVDDSIVRGTTTAHIIEMLKGAGATEVHVRISSPKFLWPCYFGTDVPSRSELASVLYTTEQLRERIDADTLGFLSIEGVHTIARDSRLGFCDGCFTGKYPYDIQCESRNPFEK